MSSSQSSTIWVILQCPRGVVPSIYFRSIRMLRQPSKVGPRVLPIGPVKASQASLWVLASQVWSHHNSIKPKHNTRLQTSCLAIYSPTCHVRPHTSVYESFKLRPQIESLVCNNTQILPPDGWNPTAWSLSIGSPWNNGYFWWTDFRSHLMPRALVSISMTAMHIFTHQNYHIVCISVSVHTAVIDESGEFVHKKVPEGWGEEFDPP